MTSGPVWTAREKTLSMHAVAREGAAESPQAAATHPQIALTPVHDLRDANEVTIHIPPC